MLEKDPEKRATIEELVDDEWLEEEKSDNFNISVEEGIINPDC